MMIDILLIVIGILAGTLAGVAVAVRHFTHEMTNRIGPNMDLVRLKLDNLQSGVELALAYRHAELYNQQPPALGPVRQPRSDGASPSTTS